MDKKQLDTEKRILDAAKNVFIKKGMSGTRMQEIADEAGINKSLLHYYFRNKETLFYTVFEESLLKMLPMLAGLFDSEKELFGKIELFFEHYISFLISNPYLPEFILHELNMNPELLLNKFLKGNISTLKNIFFKQVEQEHKNGNIIDIKPSQLLINMISLSVFPIVAEPLLKGIFEMSEDDFHSFLISRKKELADFVINSIKVK
ncbi:MAG: TetR/AcrR family transcriptional regulator [Bacteroidota bacterium]|nr:TetR/AcrR family transcriptional regulator [Bacteroidota bacterium]